MDTRSEHMTKRISRIVAIALSAVVATLGLSGCSRKTGNASSSRVCTISLGVGPNEECGVVSIGSIPDVLCDSVIETNDEFLTVEGTTAKAVANAGYVFSGWSASDGSIVAGDMTITAEFKRSGSDAEDDGGEGEESEAPEKSECLVTFEVSPPNMSDVTYGELYLGTENGTEKLDLPHVIKTPIGKTISIIGNKITIDGKTIEAVPGPGAKFVGWAGDLGRSKSVTKDSAAIARFSRKIAIATEYSVSFAADEGGKVSDLSPKNGPEKMIILKCKYATKLIAHGTRAILGDQEIVAVPDESWEFDRWEDGDGNVLPDADSEEAAERPFRTIDENTDLCARFKRKGASSGGS